MKSTNPATGELIATYDPISFEKTDRIIKKAAAAQSSWQDTPFEKRAVLLRRAADLLRENAREYGRLMAREMGKPVYQGVSEAEKCAWVCDYYANHGADFLAPQEIDSDAVKSYVIFQPLGVVLAVMPWNFPFWQVFRFAAPTLMAGNAGLLKHASNVLGCALAIEKVFKDAGFPKNLFRTLLIESKQVDSVIKNDLVRAVTLTGSTKAGQAVAQTAGSVLKKTVLELGGSDAYVILEDADIDSAVKTCVHSRLINSGQSCIAAKRFVVVKSQLEKFTKQFVEEMSKQKMGDPFDEEADIGPQARHDLRDELHEQVRKSIEKGAKCLLGGEVPNSKGAFYPPTVLTDVLPGMPAYEEELFGPVASIIAAEDEADAIRIANDTVFGLGGAVFTRDVDRGEKIAAEQLQAGACFVNTFVKSDPRLPFGGIKESGYGRELSSFGIHEFVNIKTVYVA